MKTLKFITNKSRIAIRLFSDCHLEYNSRLAPLKPITNEDLKCFSEKDMLKSNLDNTNTVAILAGDIGHPFRPELKKFLIETKKKFDFVLYTPGNHEFYSNRNMDEIENELEKICDDAKIIYMNKKVCKINNIKFIGCTLWSYVKHDDYQYVTDMLNDLSRIRIHGNKMSIDQYVSLHANHLAWLKSELDTDKSTIVITHHAPTNKLMNPKYENDRINTCYFTDLEYLMEPPIIAWFSGHSHYSYTVNVNGVDCTSNCMGYLQEYKNEKTYREDFLKIF